MQYFVVNVLCINFLKKKIDVFKCSSMYSTICAYMHIACIDVQIIVISTIICYSVHIYFEQTYVDTFMIEQIVFGKKKKTYTLLNIQIIKTFVKI